MPIANGRPRSGPQVGTAEDEIIWWIRGCMQLPRPDGWPALPSRAWTGVGTSPSLVALTGRTGLHVHGNYAFVLLLLS